MVAQYLTPMVSMAQNKSPDFYFGGPVIVGDRELNVHTGYWLDINFNFNFDFNYLHT
jgi:hypothetical protein